MTDRGAGQGAALIWCPFPDRAAAETAIHALLDENLAACGNLIEGVRSIFVWNGERDAASETCALIKTNARLLDMAIRRLAELHPYDEPAVVGWNCDSAAPATLEWLGGIGG